MALRVPELQREIVGEAPVKTAQVSGNAPIEAFGGGQQGITEAANKLAGTAGDVYEKIRDQANKSALTGLDLKLSSEQTRVELEVKKMQGLNAAGAKDYAQKEWEKISQSVQDTAANGDQIAGVKALAAARYGQIDKVVQTHTADEMAKHDQMQTESFVESEAQHAVDNYNDPSRIAQAKDNQVAQLERLGQRSGWSKEILDQKTHDSLSLTNSAIVNKFLDSGDYHGAQSYYDANKQEFSVKDMGHVEESLKGGKTLMAGRDAWTKYGGLKLADGNPDEAKMEKAVMADPELPDLEKEKVLSFVKAKAGEARSQKSQKDAATDRAFMDQAIKSRKGGVPLEQALPLARKMSIDPYDQSLKEEALRKIYAPAEVKTDQEVNQALLDGIDEGTVSRDQIDKAYHDNKLSPSDWHSARERYHNTVSEGKSPAMQQANEQLKLLAKSRFGSDTTAQAAFLSEVRSAAMGKSPEETVKIANDKLKEDQKSASRFWNWIPMVGGTQIPGTAQPQYETDLEKRTQNSLAVGQLHQDLGVETVKAIQLGAVRSGSKAAVPETVEAMSVAFGGYDKMKPGTPAYNAMQSLSKRGKIVTVESVKKALEHYPDGNF